MKKAQQETDPYNSAFNKLYFVNMLSGDKNKASTFNEAMFDHPRLAALAEKIGPKELEFLIDRIEATR